MTARWDRVEQDLRYVFSIMPLKSLRHLRGNRHRLVRNVYRTEDGRGCVMNLLTEILTPGQRIHSRETLKQFFAAPETPPDERVRDPLYQPARWIVRLWDGQACDKSRDRYGSVDGLSEERLFAVLDAAIAEREALEAEAEQVRTDVVARLARISHEL